MKKSLLVLLSLFTLLLTGCDSWMSEDNFFTNIEKDVKVANASKISVYVRYAQTKQGKTDPEGYTTFKVKIPQSVTAVTEQEYGFVKWAAFSTDFLATGDKQSQNKDVIYVDEKTYNEKLAPKEIKSSIVSFEDPTSPTTNVTINEVRNDIFLVPIVANRPKVELSIPAGGEQNVIRNRTILINFSKPMDEESFYTTDGVFDKISITQGNLSFTADGDIEIKSDDITSHFKTPKFSKTKQMITLEFEDEYKDEGFEAQSSISITISRDVKDSSGYTMTDDMVISFTVGNQKDSLAPSINWLSGGVGENFQDFQGMYNTTGARESLGQKTKIKYEGSDDAPKDNLDAEFYSQFINNRVANSVVMRVFAEDLAGSGSGQSIEGLESSVAQVAIRARHLYNEDGTPDTESIMSQPKYEIYSSQFNNTSFKKSYRELVRAANEKIEDQNDILDETHGSLYEYDLSSFPDGLIQIDVAAIDNVSNNGFFDGGLLASEYGNGWASLFVVKDTTAPDAEANRSKVLADKAKALYGFFNASLFKDIVIIQDANNLFTDANNPKLASANAHIKWIVNPGKDKTWADSLTAEDTRWKLVSESISFTDVPLPEKDGPADFTYVLMDDMGNISKAVALESIIYDNTVPTVGKLTWELDPGITLGVITGTVLDRQTLVIPVTDETSGLKTIDISIGKVGTDGKPGAAYATPFANSGLKVYIDNQELVQGTDYEISGTKLTLIEPNEPFDSKIRIRGLQISDSVSEGSFVVEVNAIDAAFNKDVSKRSSRLENDSTSPVIEKICVPEIDIKRGIEPSVGATEAGQNEYWADYTKLDTTSINPKANIYITLKEDSSGVKIFDFDSSTIKLTSSSELYVLESGLPAGEEPEAIECDIDTFNNKLTITNNEDAVLSPLNGSITVKITNVELSEKAARVNLSLYDIATNKSLDAEGSKFTLENANDTQISEFMYDKVEPVIKADSFYLRDRQLLAGSKPAEDGYTNEIYVDTGIEIEQGTPTGSGVYKITVDGAEFVKTGADKTTISVNAGGTDLAVTDFEISSDNKTITFTNTDNSCFTAFKNSYVISIKNLKLPQDDGNKIVTIKVTSIGGKESDVHTKSIILDTASPQWNSDGLYAYKDTGIDAAKVYPHPSADSGSKAYGIKLSQDAQELYFYTASKIAIAGDISDINLNPQHLSITKTSGTISSNTAANNSVYNYTLTSDCTFTAYAYDKAGNKSTDITFHIVKDDLFAASPASIDEYMTLTMPQNGAIFRNALPSLTNYNQTGFDYVDSSASASAMKAYNYVIKQNTSTYTLKIKLGSGINASDKNLVGETPAAKQTYEELYATGTSSPIEYYSISHWYGTYNSAAASAAYVPLYPEASSKPKWHSYTKSSSRYSDVDVASYIDSNGDIVIELPKTKNCPPLALLLKDGCGNTTYRMIKPVSMTDNTAAVAWIVDGVIGIGDNKQGRETFIYPNVRELADSEVQTQGAVEIGNKLYMLNEASSPRYHEEITEHSGTSEAAVSGMVKNTVAGVTYYNQSVFGTLPKLVLEAYNDTCFYAEPGAGSENEYTLKSRILAVPASAAAPTRSDFIAADDSTRASDWKYVKTSSIDSAIYMVHNYPTFDSTTPYKIYYIVEDTVGNYEINTIVNGDANDAYTLWMYDNVSPTAVLKTAARVNTIEGINYYSANSDIQADVTDSYSGIRSIESTVYNFENQQTHIVVSGLSSKIPAANGNLLIEEIKDFTGNISTNIPLQNNQSTSWIKQIAPTLSTGTANETVITPDTDAYFFEAPVQGSTATGLTYNVKGDRYLTRIDVNLRVDRHDSEQLLGWLVTHSPIAEEDFLDFYPQDYDGIQTFEGNVYSYEKSDNSKTWDEVHNDTYFYAINRAGLICRAPIAIHFVANPIPKVVGNITYEGVVICETETPKVNYTKENSKVIFATKNNTAGNPTICRIYYDANTYTDFTLANYKIDDDENGNPIYAVPLGAASGEGTVLQNLFNDTLRMYLRTASDQESDEYQLLGNGNNNKWTFDQTAPVYTLVSVTDFNNTQKIQNGIHFLINNPTIKFNINDADIDHYKYEIQDVTTGAEYTDITSSIANIMRTENPISMTYLLNTPEELKTYNFRAIDRAKNESIPITINIQKDATPPVGIIGYTLKDQNGQTADLANNTTYGTYIDYTTAQSAGAPSVSTIIYNPAYVKTIDLSPSVNDGTGIGIADSVNDYLFFKIDGGAETAYAGTITLNASWNNKTYEIVAKDKLGNSTVLKKFIFTAHGTIPNVTSENTSIEYPELAAAPQYNGHTIAGFGNDTEHFSIASVARQILTPIASDGTRTVWKFNSNPSITLPVDYSSLPSKVLYYSFTYNNVDEPLTPAEWRRANDVSGGSFIAVLNAADLEEIKSRQTFIFVWYKDEVGNITVHNLTHPGEVSQNWWTTEASKNITAAPRGNFEYVFQNQDGSASTEAGSSNFGTFFKTDNDETKTVTVTYNPAYVKTLALSHDEIQHSGSGLPTKHLFFRIDASTALDPATFGSETPEDYADSITLGDNWNGKKYEIVAVDNIGHAAVLKTFIFTAHGNAPDIASKADVTYSGNQATAYAGVKGFGTDTNYTVSTVLPAGATTQEFPSVPNNQKLIRVFTGTTSLTLPVTASSLPSTKLYYTITYDSVTEPSAFSNWTQVSTAEILNGKIENVAINLSNVSLSKDNPSYIFIWYKDEISNVTKYNLTYPQETSQNLWMTDTTNPSGTITWDLKDNDNTSQEERTSTTAGAYFKSESGTTITITYNPALIKKLVLSSQMTDAGVGLDNLHLYSKVDGSALSTTAIDQNVIDLTDITDHSTRTYEIYAKDHVGHISTLLKTFVFKPHGTVPVVPEEEVSYSGITTPQYKTQNVKGFAADTAYETPAEVPYITDNSGTRVFVNSDSDDSVEFTLPVAELPSNKMYYAVQYYTADNIDDFDAPVANDWIQTTFASGASATQTVTVDLNQLSEDKDKPTFIFVWYKDEISNICVHNLTYHYSTDQGDAVDNGWMWDNDKPVPGVNGGISSYALAGPDMDMVKQATEDELGTFAKDESVDGMTVSIGYSPEFVKTIKLTSGVIDTGVGLAPYHLYYKNTTINGELTLIDTADNEVTLPETITAGFTEETYEIYAKDRVGNVSDLLKTFKFKPHSSAPQVANEITINYTSELESNLTYKNEPIKGFGADTNYSMNWNPGYISSLGSYSFAEITDEDDDSQKTTFRLPVIASSLPSAKLYYAITYNSIDEPELTSTEWQRRDLKFGETIRDYIEDVTIDQTKVKAGKTLIFVWYKDDLGNVCVHNLTYPENTSQNLWTTVADQDSPTVPTGAISWTPKDSSENTTSERTPYTSGTYFKVENGTGYGSTDTITYNPNIVKKLLLDTTVITNSGAGLPNPCLFYKVDGVEYAFTGTSGDATSGFGELILGQPNDEDYDSWKTGKTYEIIAKDKIGHTSVIKTFVFKAHGTAPTIASEQNVTYTGTTPTYNGATITGFGSHANYNVSATLPNGTTSTEIPSVTDEGTTVRVFTGTTTFTLPVTASSLPLTSTKLYYAITYDSYDEPTTGWTQFTVSNSTNRITNVVIDYSDSTKVSVDKASPTYIYIWYKDEIGNICVHNLTCPTATTQNLWMTDTTAPTGTISSYTVGGSNAINATTGDLGTYYTSDSTDANSKPVTTITYNPAYVNQITLTSGMTDAGVGLDTYHLYYKKAGDTAYTLIENDVISLADIANGTTETFYIYAKDRVNNYSGLLKTFVFKAHGTAPTAAEQTVSYASGTESTYNGSTIKGFGASGSATTNYGVSTTTTYTGSSTSTVTTIEDGSNTINIFADETKFTLPFNASSLPPAADKLYYAVTYDNVTEPSKFDSSKWTLVGSSDFTAGKISNVEIVLNSVSADITNPSYIFVWYRDQLGNISVHNLTNPGTAYNKWVADTAAPTGSISGYQFKKNTTVALESTDDQLGTFLKSESVDEKTATIIYNPAYIETLTLTPSVSDGTNVGVGVTGNYLWYKFKSASDTNFGDYVQIENNIINLTDITADTTVTYQIYAKDRVGRISEVLKTFVLTPYTTIPAVANETTISYRGQEYKGFGTDYYYSVSSSIKTIEETSGEITVFTDSTPSQLVVTYDSPVFENVFTEDVSFSLPVTPSSLPSKITNSKKVYYAITYDDVTTPTTWSNAVEVASTNKIPGVEIDYTSSVSRTKSVPSYIFVWYRDQIGNINVHSLTNPAAPAQYLWMTDTNAPTGAVTAYTPQKSNGDAATAATTSASGDYLIDTTSTANTTIITYNPAAVKKIALSHSVADNAGGVGIIENQCLYYKIGDNGTLTQTAAGNIIDLTTMSDASRTYHIYAQDRVGNTSSEIRTLIVRKHGTAPVVEKENTVSYSGITGASSYKGFGTDTNYALTNANTVGSITESSNTIKVFTANTSFTLPVTASSLPPDSTTLYYAITYDSVTTPTTWNGPVDVSSGKLTNVAITLDSVSVTKSSPSYIFVWYKDEIGNICCHNLTFPGTTNNLWMTDTTGPVIADGEESGISSYTLGGTNAGDADDASTDNYGTYVASESNGTVTITYNPDYVTTIALTPSVTDAGVGLAQYYLYDADDNLIADNNIALGTSEATYAIYAKDRVGNKSALLKTFVFKPYTTIPAPAATAEQTIEGLDVKGFGASGSSTTNFSVSGSISTPITEGDNIIRVIRVFTGAATFTLPVDKTTLPAANKALWYAVTYNSTTAPATAGAWTTVDSDDVDNGKISDVAINMTNTTLVGATKTNPIKIYVWFRNAIGNVSVHALTYPGTDNYLWMKDITGPVLTQNGSITGTLQKKKADNSFEDAVVAGASASGDYIVSGNTYTYNPIVKQFVLDASDVTDAGVGVSSDCLWYKKGEDGTLTQGSVLSLSGSGTETFYIYAKDKVGNTSSNALATFTFVAHGTAPAAGEGKTTTVTYAGVASGSAPTVKAFAIAATNITNTDGIKVITESSNNIEVFTTDTTSTFTLPVVASALPSTKLYYAIQYLNKDTISKTLTAPTTGWSQTTVANDATSVDIAIASTSVSTSKAKPSFIFVWYKDELGNAGVYNIAFPRAGENDSTVYHNLWMKDTAAPTGTVGGTPQKLDGESATNVADATSGIGDYIVSTSEGTVTYRYNPAVVKRVELTDTITEEGVGLEGLYISTTGQNNAEVLTKITDNIITLSGNTASTYKIKAKDKVGHTSGLLTTFVFEPDSLAPDGNVGYLLKNSSAETVAAHTDSAIGAYHVDVDSNTNISTITYNPAVAKTIALTSSIQDKGGLSESDAGVGLPQKYLFFKIDDSTTLTDYSETITLGSDWNGKKYAVVAKDKVGNESTKITLVFKAHGTAPATTEQTVSYGENVTAPTYNSVAISGFGTATTHYSMSPAATEIMTGEEGSQTGTGVYKFAAATQEAPNTTFTLPVTLSSLPTSKVYYALTYNSALEPASWSGPVTVTNDETTGNQITGVTIDMTKVTGSKVFIFAWLKDELGNITVRNLTFPGTSANKWTTESSQNTNYDPMVNVTPEPRKSNSSAALAATATTRGEYFINSSGKIIYNPQSVKKLGFITNEGTTLTYKIGDNGDYAAMTNNELDISSFTAETTVKVKATDAFGNTTTNRTAYVIQPDSSAPTVDSSYIKDSNNRKFLKGYTAKKPDGSNISVFNLASDNIIWGSGKTNYYELGTKIFFAKNKITDSLTDVVSYKYVTSRDAQASTQTYEATASITDTDWLPIVVSGDNYSFELPDITTPNTHLALFFMDSVGNISQTYWIDKIDGGGNDWWITDHTLTAADISISSSPATFPGNGKTATLTITLPEGMVVKTVSYTDCSKDGNINFSGYAQGDANWSGTDNKPWINLTTMTVKVKFNQNSGSGAKITINGVSKKIF